MINNKGNTLIICLYVDDVLISTSLLLVEKIKAFLSSVFKMKDMGEAYVILGNNEMN